MKDSNDSGVYHILTIIASIVASIALIVFLFAINMKTTLIDPNYYKTTLQKTDTYNQLLTSGIPSLITNINISDDTSTDFLAKQAIIYVINKSIPTSWVQEQTEKFIDATANFIATPQENPVVSLKLENLGLYLSQINDGLTVLEQIIPSCAESSTANNSAIKQILNVSIDCKNMTYNLDDVKKTIADTRTQISKIKSEEVNITKQVEKGYEAFVGLQNLTKNVSVYLWTSLAIFIIMIGLICYFQYRNIFTLSRYVAYPLLISSVVVLIVASSAKSPMIYLVDQLLNINIDPAIQTIINNFAEASVKGFFSQLQLSSTIIAIVSVIILIVIWILMHRHNKHK